MLFGYLVLASLAFFTLWVIGYWLNCYFESLSEKWQGANKYSERWSDVKTSES
ncbi:MAG: hypothetical protein IAF58_12790 [Leptolyngbya sp.]|nr:hypothetical protein [Candidatus Melainabacteria bacterium]